MDSLKVLMVLPNCSPKRPNQVNSLPIMHESASLPAPPGNHVEEDGLEGVTGTAEALPCPSAFSIPVHVPDT